MTKGGVVCRQDEAYSPDKVGLERGAAARLRGFLCGGVDFKGPKPNGLSYRPDEVDLMA